MKHYFRVERESGASPVRTFSSRSCTRKACLVNLTHVVSIAANRSSYGLKKSIFGRSLCMCENMTLPRQSTHPENKRQGVACCDWYTGVDPGGAHQDPGGGDSPPPPTSQGQLLTSRVKLFQVGVANLEDGTPSHGITALGSLKGRAPRTRDASCCRRQNHVIAKRLAQARSESTKSMGVHKERAQSSLISS